MNTQKMPRVTRRGWLGAAALAGMTLAGLVPAQGAQATVPSSNTQEKLLGLAFNAVSLMPLMPHEKNRCRGQQRVVEACLEVGRPDLALNFLEKITNWRRGVCYADYAMYLAQSSRSEEEIRPYLELALNQANRPEEELRQEWRRDRILTRIGEVELVLGNHKEAQVISQAMLSEGAEHLNAQAAKLSENQDIEDQLAQLDEVLKAGSFESVKAATAACADLYDRYYQDKSKRELVEKALESSRGKLPLELHLGVIERLARAAREHGDSDQALTHLEEGRALMDQVEWLPQAEIPMRARFAGARGLAGEQEEARRDLEASLALFLDSRGRIADVFRCEALLPVAEAYVDLGSPKAALTIYRKAITEGSLNPNSRPRADDLAGACISMAIRGVEPDQSLWLQINGVLEGLGDPW